MFELENTNRKSTAQKYVPTFDDLSEIKNDTEKGFKIKFIQK